MCCLLCNQSVNATKQSTTKQSATKQSATKQSATKQSTKQTKQLIHSPSHLLGSEKGTPFRAMEPPTLMDAYNAMWHADDEAQQTNKQTNTTNKTKKTNKQHRTSNPGQQP